MERRRVCIGDRGRSGGEGVVERYGGCVRVPGLGGLTGWAVVGSGGGVGYTI